MTWLVQCPSPLVQRGLLDARTRQGGAARLSLEGTGWTPGTATGKVSETSESALSRT